MAIFNDNKGIFTVSPAKGGGGGTLEGSEINDTQTTTSNTWSAKKIDTELKKIVADVNYKPITINNVSNNKATAEKGSTVTNVVVTWSLSKSATKQEIESTVVPNNSNTYTHTGNITANKTFALKVTDERGATATKTTAVTFYNGIFYGSTSVAVSNEMIKSLTKTLSDTKGRTFTTNCGAGQYIYYCLPKRLGDCAFKVGGFDGGFNKMSDFEFTNESGFKEVYAIYKSTNSNLGNTTVQVI